MASILFFAKALGKDARILVMDEPTSSLTAGESQQLFGIIRQLQSEGIGIIYISHRMAEIFAHGDRVTVLRDGKLVGEYLTREFLRIDLVHAMLGRSADSLRTRSLLHVADDRKEPYLSARSVSVGSGISGADVDLVEGEVLGVAGLAGLLIVLELVPRLGLVDEKYLPPASTIAPALADEAV